MNLDFNSLLTGGQEKEYKSERIISVEHPMKNAINKILPANYRIEGYIYSKINVVNGKTSVGKPNLQEFSELTGNQIGFLRNLRDLKKKDVTEKNPYEDIIKVEEVNINVFGLDIDIEGARALSYISKRLSGTFKKKELFLGTLIFTEKKDVKTQLEEEGISQILGFNFSNNNNDKDEKELGIDALTA